MNISFPNPAHVKTLDVEQHTLMLQLASAWTRKCELSYKMPGKVWWRMLSGYLSGRKTGHWSTFPRSKQRHNVINISLLPLWGSSNIKTIKHNKQTVCTQASPVDQKCFKWLESHIRGGHLLYIITPAQEIRSDYVSQMHITTRSVDGPSAFGLLVSKRKQKQQKITAISCHREEDTEPEN